MSAGRTARGSYELVAGLVAMMKGCLGFRVFVIVEFRAYDGGGFLRVLGLQGLGLRAG